MMIALLVCLGVGSVVRGACLDKNTFLAKLEAGGVTVFVVPQPSTSPTCAHEWKSFLTCCGPEKLKAYAQSKTLNDRSAYQDAKNELQQAAVALAAALREFSSLESAMSRCHSLADLSSEITEFKRQTTQFFLVSEKHQALEQQCFNKTERIRNYVLCYTCSGRSELFFQNGKARISLEDCKGVIDECSFLWNRAIQLIDTLDLAQAIVNKLKKKFSSTLGSIEFTSAVNLRCWIDSLNLRTTVKLCSNSSALSCDPTTAKSVCENLVSLHQTSFVENALQAVKSDVEQLPTLNLATQRIHTQVVETVRINHEISTQTGKNGGVTTESFHNMCSTSSTTTIESSSDTGEDPNSQVKEGETLWGLGLRRRLYTAPSSNFTGSGDTQVIVDPPRNCTNCMPLGWCPDCP